MAAPRQRMIKLSNAADAGEMDFAQIVCGAHQ
jgi:hypothetical protein